MCHAFSPQLLLPPSSLEITLMHQLRDNHWAEVLVRRQRVMWMWWDSWWCLDCHLNTCHPAAAGVHLIQGPWWMIGNADTQNEYALSEFTIFTVYSYSEAWTKQGVFSRRFCIFLHIFQHYNYDMNRNILLESIGRVFDPFAVKTSHFLLMIWIWSGFAQFLGATFALLQELGLRRFIDIRVNTISLYIPHFFAIHPVFIEILRVDP